MPKKIISIDWICYSLFLLGEDEEENILSVCIFFFL